MVGIPRQGAYGFPVRLPRSIITQVKFLPTDGYTDSPDIVNTPGSLTSAANVWIWQNRLVPRPRLQQLGSNNPLGDAPTGAMLYNDISGSQYVVVSSRATVSYLNGTSWTPLAYVSGTSNNPPSGGANDPFLGASTYLPRADANLLVFTNGVDPVFAWAGPSNGTGYSTLTQGYICEDVVPFDTRLVYWNVRYLSSSSQLVTRAAWTVKGDPENSTGVGAGYTDLLDMRGVGTRIFTRVDELLLATDQEIWRGRAVGPPFDFQFDPFSRTLGIPYQRAAIQTPDGLFWLGQDFMIYRIDPYYATAIEPVGKAIQRTLHETMADATTAYFGYHADARQLSLYYTPTAGTAPKRAFTLNTLTGTWTPQTFTHGLQVGFTAQAASASAATQWNQLTGTFAAQTLTYAQMLGGTAAGGPALECTVSSGGTAYVFQHPKDQATDDGTSVEHTATFGPVFEDIPERTKFVDTVRLDCRADLASTLSVALSGDLGASFPSEQTFAVSVQSATTQQITRWGQTGTYHTTRVRSTGGAWELTGVAVKGRVGGETI